MAPADKMAYRTSLLNELDQLQIELAGAGYGASERLGQWYADRAKRCEEIGEMLDWLDNQ